MIRSYLKIAWRSLLKNKGYTLLNVFGLALGLAVVLLVGLWIHDELSFNKYHKNYDRIAQVMQSCSYNGERFSQFWNPHHLGNELRNNYGGNFEQVVMSTWQDDFTLTRGDKKFTRTGNYMEAEAPAMLSLEMVKGSHDGLKDPYSVLLAESVAQALFGEEDPLHKVIRFANQADLTVTGVYKDLPQNSEFSYLSFIAPWKLLLILNPGIATIEDPWNNNSFLTYVKVREQADFKEISRKIKDIRVSQISKESAEMLKPEMFLHPMSKWHLYSDIIDGMNSGGRIEFVWLFGLIGVFVLLLACINFINLSTARSQSRAREIGVRKAIGAVRRQLVIQFFLESLLVVFFAFLLGLLLVQLILPSFNDITNKALSVLGSGAWFWFMSIGICLLTGLLAGLYPSLYLSSFQPVKVLKGTYRAGRMATTRRKALVIVQFSVSVILILGTFVVLRQIEFAKDRSAGYKTENLIMAGSSPEIHQHFKAFQDELKKSGAVEEVAEAINRTTDYYVSDNQFEWEGKDPNASFDIPLNYITTGYGKTIGWEILEGRDFSGQMATDSAGFIINEAAAAFFGFEEPVGKTIEHRGKPFRVIGVIRDIIFDSPYKPVKPYIYLLTPYQPNFVMLKLNAGMPLNQAIEKIRPVFEKHNPGLPFDYKFVDEEYAAKFGDEERIGKLAGFFAVLAIIICCLGVFGLSTLMAEQRTKEIGIRKILGSSVVNIWALMSGEFVMLVVISLLVSFPIAFYFLSQWLENYEYRADLSWWIFAVAGISLLVITLLTASYQAIKAATANPVKSLRTE